jgi:hypothetical protein
MLSLRFAGSHAVAKNADERASKSARCSAFTGRTHVQARHRSHGDFVERIDAGGGRSATRIALSDLDSLEVKCSNRRSQAGQLSTFSVDNDVHRLYKPMLSSNWQMPFARALKSYAG